MNHALRADSASSSVDQRSARTFEGLRNLVAKVATAIKISTAALAAALPLNVAGILLLRLIKDLKEVGIDGLTLRAFQDAGFPHIDAYFPAPRERAIQHARRSRVALLYSMGIAALSIALTVTGMAAALWHLGQWIALVLVSSVVLSAALVTIAIAHGLPPESDAEKRLKRMLAIPIHRDRRRQ